MTEPRVARNLSLENKGITMKIKSKKDEHNRLNLDFYQNRVDTNIAIKKFLINKIFEHDPDFKMDKESMMAALVYEDLLEIAIAVVNKDLRIVLGRGRDYCDNSDAKFTCVRTSGYGKSYSAMVSGTRNKIGDLRVQCYERKLDQFYYFVIPYKMYKDVPKTSNIEIRFNLDGTPKRENNCRINWWDWEEASFEDMCTVTHTGEK
jgi:hypothetical protein